jgi:hypothetical protein
MRASQTHGPRALGIKNKANGVGTRLHDSVHIGLAREAADFDARAAV